MGFRDDIRKLCHEVRAIPGRDFEMRLYTIAVVRRTWSGDQPGEGTETVTTTPITEAGGFPPRVEVLNEEQLALGNFPKGSLKVGNITPDFPGGGTSAATLSPTDAANGEIVHYLVTGPDYPNGARFQAVQVHTHSPFHYELTLSPLSLA